MNNSFSGPTAATGVALETTTDSANQFYIGNHFNGWPISLGCGATTAGICFTTTNGYYDFPNVPFTIPAVTPSFATPGNFVPANVSRNGTFFLRGNYVDYRLNYNFDTNAYTTSSGVLTFRTAIPTPLDPGVIHGGCVLGSLTKVTMIGAGTILCNALGSTAGSADFQLSSTVTNAARRVFDEANFPPSITGIRLDLGGRYQIR